ncbi:MAG TPA: hypothetical protein VGX03_19320, partial [Candidatus Binatia bacterium]|nr:hypothetical protein [Candidatus Binatia bacterium]
MGPRNSIPHSHHVNRIDGKKKMGKGTPLSRSLAAPYCRAQVLVWLLLFLLPSGASAAMPPWVYQQARDTAMFHVQVKIRNVTGPAQTPGECSVTGEVVRIFRNTPGTLQQGATLDFTVSCSKHGDPVIVGGTLWTDYDSLMRAKYLEVFLN